MRDPCPFDWELAYEVRRALKKPEQIHQKDCNKRATAPLDSPVATSCTPLAQHFTRELGRLWENAEQEVTPNLKLKLDRQKIRCGDEVRGPRELKKG